MTGYNQSESEADFEDMLAAYDRIIADKALQQKLLDAGLLVRVDPGTGEPDPQAVVSSDEGLRSLLTFPCDCPPDYTERGRHAPDCRYQFIHDYLDDNEIAAILAHNASSQGLRDEEIARLHSLLDGQTKLRDELVGRLRVQGDNREGLDVDGRPLIVAGSRLWAYCEAVAELLVTAREDMYREHTGEVRVEALAKLGQVHRLILDEFDPLPFNLEAWLAATISARGWTRWLAHAGSGRTP